MLVKEKPAQPLSLNTFETANFGNIRVSAFSTVHFATNDYSVPCTYVGRQVDIRAYPEVVENLRGWEIK
jgi:hypothetical protein